MFHQCQTTFPPSTKIPLFTFQHFFSSSISVCTYSPLRSILLTGVSPCHCDQVRVTGHGLSFLIVKFLIFIFFFQAWELFHDITHFLKQHIFLPLFPIVLVTNLVTPITCQHLPNLISGHCQKFFSQNFNFFTSRQLYLAAQLFG